MPTERAQGWGLLASVNLMFLSQVASYGLAFVVRAVLAQALGDEGLGTYSLFYTSVLVAAGLANLGVGPASVFYLNRGAYSLERLLGGATFLWASVAVLWALGVALFGVLYGPDAFVSGRAFWLYAPAVPAVVAYLFLVAFLQGQHRFGAIFLAGASQGVSSVASLGTLWALGRLDLFGAVASWVGSFVLADAIAFVLLRPWRLHWREVIQRPWQALRDQIRYGVQGQLGNLAQLLNYRLDHYLVGAFAGRAAVGHYTVAVGLAESLWWLASAVSYVLLPRLSGMGQREAAALAQAGARNTFLVSLLGAVALAGLSPVLVTVVFGSEFRASVLPLALLLPGALANGVTIVLGSYLYSRGRPLYQTGAVLVALLATVVLDLALIPWLEVPGAAIASSLAYNTGLAAALYFYRRVSGRSLSDLLGPSAGDLEMMRELWLALWRRLRARPEP
ncbi:MAG: oligosaccharide flippase family protein [Dehalococcoidia bacterium]|mgnify:CR=1 FL=1|jgi:O-antigen/teichoic acid export membrane protein|nr:oligosaccharide flippase family protein [Dehalococcoidia bacterium]MDW8008641.1 oligosaccharide flippase family protein [Chloroflexota bacterium]